MKEMKEKIRRFQIDDRAVVRVIFCGRSHSTSAHSRGRREFSVPQQALRSNNTQSPKVYKQKAQEGSDRCVACNVWTYKTAVRVRERGREQRPKGLIAERVTRGREVRQPLLVRAEAESARSGRVQRKGERSAHGPLLGFLHLAPAPGPHHSPATVINGSEHSVLSKNHL